MHNELNFVTLDRIYEHVMKDGEEKLNNPHCGRCDGLFEEFGRPNVVKEADLQPPALPCVHHVSSPAL